MIGQMLAHYRVTAAIGAGGMGAVYRATDTHLDRDVAIKVLPAEVADDSGRLGRFRREAHLLASLNHTNIAAIYGLEESGGKHFLVLELVEGEGLEARLGRGAMAVDEALEIARQVAEALEEAHNKGVVHRDLKPANVKLTPDGRVKVLDFGLAKAWAATPSDGSSPSAALSQSLTLAQSATMAGVILGTAAYMSPEQARGRAVDRRTDVWSFGVLLWEMLTGRTLFSGDTVADVIAAVVTKEPDLDALPTATPRAVRRLLARCLRKDPRARLPDIGAARLELQDAIASPAGEAEAPVAKSAGAPEAGFRRRRESWAWAAVALAAVGVAAAFVRSPEVPRRTPAVRMGVDAPAGWSFTDFGWPVPSPDGRQVVFIARPDGPAGTAAPAMLWTRPLESLSARPLTGTEGADQGIPFWSPDGTFLAFFAGGELRKLNVADGTVHRICSMPSPGNIGADWSKEGVIVFSAGGFGGRIYSVAATGGEARPLTTLDAARGETHHHAPQFLPDGRRFLFLIASTQEQSSGLYVAPLRTPAERRQVAAGWLHFSHASGYLLFAYDRTLFAQPFDAARVERSGEAVAIASSVAGWTTNPNLGWFGVSPGGTVASFSGQSTTGRVQLAWLDRKGAQIGTVGAPGDYGQIALSPDGRSVALEVRGGASQYDLWVMDLNRGVTSRVTATPADEYDPVWSTDGLSLAYASTRADGIDLRRKRLRASEPETVLARLPDEEYPESWSRDGRTLLFCRRTTRDAKSLWALSLEPDGKAEPLVDTGFPVDEPQLSPDGRWLAYISAESGRYEVYIEPFRRDGARVRVSVDGGGQPKWRGDGKELFYTTPADRLTAVSVRMAGDRLHVGLPAELFGLREIEPIRDHYAVSADGRRFLVKLPAEEIRKPQLHVLTGWMSLLH